MIYSPIENDIAVTRTERFLDVLVVSLDKSLREMTQCALSQSTTMQCTVFCASSYNAAVKEIKHNRYDAFIIDFDLGRHTASDLLRQTADHSAQTPALVIFEAIDRSLFREAQQAGAVNCLVRNQLGSQVLDHVIQYANRPSFVEPIVPKTEDTSSKSYAALEQRCSEQETELAYLRSVSEDEFSRRQELEQWVKESLTRRARQVQTATYIAQKIASTPKLDDLFLQLVNLVQQQFGYYHAHLYMIEDDYLVMQEGTGNAGQMMKAVGHKIPLVASKSLTARAARSGQPVLIPDVTREPSWLPNGLLPETKAEIAVPIKLGDDVLGVLDVQNDTIASLDEEDQILLLGLCGQIAVAINNRRLDARRAEAEENQRRLIQELDAFAHTIGYTLRDPVSLIIGYTELLKSQAGLTDTLHEYLNSIARNSLKMSNIIDELQVLTGIRRAKVVPQPLSMLRIVAEVQQRLAHLAQEYDAKIVISEYWPTALGHKPWIEEVWANYLSNAIKYGGRPPRIYVGATAQSDGMVRFWVRDNGPGFTPEEQAQLFTEFTNISQRRITEYSLGLTIVKRIIAKLGGEVGVESDGLPNAGSIFTFTLPRA